MYVFALREANNKNRTAVADADADAAGVFVVIVGKAGLENYTLHTFTIHNANQLFECSMTEN